MNLLQPFLALLFVNSFSVRIVATLDAVCVSDYSTCIRSPFPANCSLPTFPSQGRQKASTHWPSTVGTTFMQDDLVNVPQLGSGLTHKVMRATMWSRQCGPLITERELKQFAAPTTRNRTLPTKVSVIKTSRRLSLTHFLNFAESRRMPGSCRNL